jgi:hypothetical protein
MTSIDLIIICKLVIKWLHISKELLKGGGKNIKPIMYDLFTIFEKNWQQCFLV